MVGTEVGKKVREVLYTRLKKSKFILEIMKIHHDIEGGQK